MRQRPLDARRKRIAAATHRRRGGWVTLVFTKQAILEHFEAQQRDERARFCTALRLLRGEDVRALVEQAVAEFQRTAPTRPSGSET